METVILYWNVQNLSVKLDIIVYNCFRDISDYIYSKKTSKKSHNP